MAEEGEQVTFELGGVCVHPRVRRPWGPEAPIPGVLRLLSKAGAVTLQWEPLEPPPEPPADAGGSERPGQGGAEADGDDDDGDDDDGDEDGDPVGLFDPGYEPDWAVVSAPRLPPPHAPVGGPWGFRVALGTVGAVRRGRPPRGPPFVVLVPRGGPCPPALHLPPGGARRLLRHLRGLLRLAPSPHDPRLLLVLPPGAPSPPEPGPGLVTRLLQAPYAATLGGLSRVGRLLGGPRGPAPSEEAEPPFEVISCVRLGPRPIPPRGPPVTEAEWGRSLDGDGRVRDPLGLQWRLFRGGLSEEVRARGWWRLLGLRPWGGSDGDEAARGRQRRADYGRMKLQWLSLSPGQQRRNRPLRRYWSRIEREVCGGAARPPPARALLRDMLLTYCMYNFDLGYVRGMRELLEPLVAAAPEEADAFWGFCSVMELAGSAFAGGRELLEPLGQLLRLLEPPLSERRALPGSRGLWRRLLQLRYRPPLDMGGTQRLWEVLWTGLPCPNFHLLVACAMLELLPPGDGDPAGDTPRDGDSGGHGDNDGDGDTDEDTDEDEGPPVRWPQLDADEVLSRAEGIYWQLAATAELPPALQELLGLGGPLKRPPPGAWAPPDAGIRWEPPPPTEDAGAPLA